MSRAQEKVGVLEEVADELKRARQTHGRMAGYHEGYAVILEEVDELWELVKRNTHKGDGFTKDDKLRLLRKEAIQIAAMAVRFVEDVCDKDNEPNE